MKEQVTIHVDNGGYTFAVENGSIIITDGYFGYSENRMTLNGKVTPENLAKIGRMFLRAADAMENAMEKGPTDREIIEDVFRPNRER